MTSAQIVLVLFISFQTTFLSCGPVVRLARSSCFSSLSSPSPQRRGREFMVAASRREKEKRQGGENCSHLDGGGGLPLRSPYRQQAKPRSSCQMFDLVKITLPQFNHLALRVAKKKLVGKLLYFSAFATMSKDPSLIHPSLLHDSCLLSDPLFRSPGARGKGERGRGERGVFARIINKPFLFLQQPGSRVG